MCAAHSSPAAENRGDLPGGNCGSSEDFSRSIWNEKAVGCLLHDRRRSPGVFLFEENGEKEEGH